MRQFVQRHADQILGVLSGFDRIRLRGSLRLFSTEGGVASWLQGTGVALTDFFKWAQGVTDRLRRRTEKIARDAGRPRTHRYTLTADGTTAITVLTAARHKTLAELTAA
jgi:hypothetical protein